MPKILRSFRQCTTDPHVFGEMFADPSWSNWQTIAIGLLGEPFVSDEERDVWHTFTGRDEPTKRCKEGWLICGRRAGKSRTVATIAAYTAAFIDFRDKLARKERAEIAILAQTAQQSSKLFEYCEGIFEGSELLSDMVDRKTSDVIELKNQARISIRVANFRSIRGITSPLIIADEIAYWFNSETSSNPDKAILKAARPCLTTLKGQLLCVSSPYSKRGELYEADMRYSDGHKKSIVIVKGTSQQLNPGIDQEELDDAFERDPEAFKAEFMACYRADVAALFDRDVVESLVIPDRHEIPRSKTEPYQYHAFVDVSGGGKDSFCLAIAHREGEIGVLDCLREVRPPLSLEAVVAEFATVLRSYGLAAVTGDGYGGNWPSEAFSRVGITYVVSERNKSEIYVEALPLFNSGNVELLDNKRLVDQLCSLERRTSRGTGRDIVDHPPGQHDDVANVVAGALVLAIGQLAGLDLWKRFGENAEQHIMEILARYH